MRRAGIWLVLVLLVLLPGSVSAQEDSNTLYVDVTQDLGPISPYVYGANYGPPTFVGLDMLPFAETSGINWFNIPAGEWANDNDIKRQVALFYNQVHQWGGVMQIATRLPRTGGSVEEAVELVQYTLDEGFDVPYWAIAIEPDLIEEYNGDEPGNFAAFDMEGYNRDWRMIAEAMLEVKPDMILTGPEVSQFPPTEDSNDYLQVRADFVREFLKANGDLVDVVTIHRYPFPLTATSSTTIEELRQNTPEWETMVDMLRGVIRDAVGEDMPIGITEANSHYSNTGFGEATPDSFYNAIWWADVLGRLIKKKVDIVSYFSFQSVGSLGEFGLLERYHVRPTYYVYQLYQRFGSQLVHSESADPDVTIYAALRDDEVLTLIVVNRGPDAMEKTMDLVGFDPAGEAEVWRFDAEHNAEQIADVDVVDGITLPGQSITLYALPATQP